MKIQSFLFVAFSIGCLGWIGTAAAQGTNPQNRAAVKLLFDSWKLPVPPRHLIGNINYVGAAGVSSFLITTIDGHILIDTAFEETVPLIQKNIEQLGFRWQDIKIILSSHTHIDHTGGHALMKKLTGAQIVCSAADAHLLETGGADDFSPFPKDMMKYTPIKTDRIITDGDTVTLGGVTLTAHLTPGHTKGATSWTMPTTDNGQPHSVIFLSSFSIVQGTKLVNNTDYPKIAEDFEATIKTLKSLDCDVFFAPHGGAFAMTQKFAKLDQGIKPNPLIDPEGLKRTIADTENGFRSQLAREKAVEK